MQRLTTFREGESGAVAVIVAMMLVAMLGAAAIAIDIGAIYVEKRELQNGADAGALAIAEECAGDSVLCLTTALDTARTYANANAEDGASTIDPLQGVEFDLSANKVTVTADTNDPSSANTSRLAHWFAPVFGDPELESTAVRAKSAAIWGPVAAGSLDTLPITFSLCEYNKFITSPDSKYPAGEPWSSAPLPLGNGKPIIIFLHGNGEPCNDGPSGQDLPGGFGWLDTDGTCGADVIDGWMEGSQGAPIPNECKKSGFSGDLLGKVIELPVFNESSGVGDAAKYKFYSYAAFYVAGYSFPSMSDHLIDPYTGQKFECVLPDGKKCTGSDNHLMGWFTEAPASAAGEVDPSAVDTGIRTFSLTLD